MTKTRRARMLGGMESDRQEYQKQFYQRRKDAFNQRRRDLYDADEGRRERLRADARDAMARARRAAGVKVIIADGVARWNGVTVMSAVKVAEILKRHVKTIRSWGSVGLLPAPIVPGSWRYYTDAQIGLISELSDFMGANRYQVLHPQSNPDVMGALDELTARIEDHWCDGAGNQEGPSIN